MLDDVFPPPLGIVVASGERQFGKWVGRALIEGFERCLHLGWPRCQHVGKREIDEPRGHIGIGGPAQRHPLGAKRCVGVKQRSVGLTNGVPEHGDRRMHIGVGGQRCDGVGFAWTLDEHYVWRVIAQRAFDGQSRPRTVVTHAVQANLGAASEGARGGVGVSAGRESRDTHATPPRRARDLSPPWIRYRPVAHRS